MYGDDGDPDLYPNQRRAIRGARRLDCEIWKAGPDGVTRQQLIELTGLGKETFEDAVRLLKAGDNVTHSRESRHNREGHFQPQIVFRHVDPNPTGRVPVRASRDPADQALLDEIALLELVALARFFGRTTPRRIAQWILKNPFSRMEVHRWVDVEGPLTARIELLEAETA